MWLLKTSGVSEIGEVMFILELRSLGITLYRASHQEHEGNPPDFHIWGPLHSDKLVGFLYMI